MRLRYAALLVSSAFVGYATDVRAAGAPTAKPTDKPKAAQTPAPAKQPPAAAPKGPPANVNAAFMQAQKLYQAGQYTAALAAFDAILRKYPGHEPTIVQYAKTLYKLDRIPDSYNLFARVNPQFLDPETAYEYGQSFMTAKQYEGALYAFKRVPKGHALADLANYHGAICAMKLRRYQEAEDMMDSAVVLPERLSRSRTLYIKHLQELRLMQEKKSLAQERDQERQRLGEKVAPTRRQVGTMKLSAAPAPTAYAHNGFLANYKQALLGYKYTSQELDYSGFATNTAKSNLAYFNFLVGPTIPLGFKQGKNEAAFGLQLKIGAEDLNSTGKMSRVVVQDDSPEILRIDSQPPENKHSKAGIVSAAPWVEVPGPNSTWFGLGSEIIFRYADFERAGRTGSREGFAHVGWKSANYDVLARGSYFDTVNTETKPNMTRVHGDVRSYAHPTVLPNFLGTFGVQREQFTYPDDTLDGPDASTAATVRLEQGLPLGFLLGSFASFEQQEGYVGHNLAGFDTIVANGQVLTGKVYLSNTIGTFFMATVSQLWQKTTWAVQTQDAQEDFERNVPNYNATFVGDVSVNLWF